MLVAIWAEDENGLIGAANQMPWHLPEDLKRFKKKTLNNVIVMGRKTYEGLGKKTFSGRKTIVLTSNKEYVPAQREVLVMHSVSEVLGYAKKITPRKIYIAGGSSTYQEFEPYVDQLMRTVIHRSFTGDAYFPRFDYSKFKKVKTRAGVKDEKNPYSYEFETFVRL